MPYQRLSNFVLFSHLELVRSFNWPQWQNNYECQVKRHNAFCTKCGALSESIYDHRLVKVKDAPIRQTGVLLHIRKRRFFCKECQKPFTERLPGILPKQRTTQRYQQNLLWAAETFQNLAQVVRHFRCSSGFLYKALYDQLDRKRKRNLYPWPEVIGIDEHSFQSRRKGGIPFATLIVDFKNKKPFELVDSKQKNRLIEALTHIPGRENVRRVALDLSDSYRSFVREFFPNAELIADKFHVLRLIHPMILQERKKIAVHKPHSLHLRRLLLSAPHRLSWEDKSDLHNLLEEHPKLKTLWLTKEKLHAFYRTRGLDRARWALHKLIDSLKNTDIPELQRLARTLFRWAREILNYFEKRITNARTEGFNRIAKLVNMRACGYKRFENYRLRFLCACF